MEDNLRCEQKAAAGPREWSSKVPQRSALAATGNARGMAGADAFADTSASAIPRFQSLAFARGPWLMNQPRSDVRTSWKCRHGALHARSRLRAPMISLLAFLVLLHPVSALTPLKVLRRDWVALNMRSTCRHLLRPSTPVGASECLKLKVEIQQAVQDGAFVVDAFSRCAAEHSIDADTRDTGGLLGTRLQQGELRSRRSSRCPAPELDRAAFEVPIGKVYGPFQSDFGYHLFLVEERIGYKRQDGEMTRVVPEPFAPGDTRVRSVLAKPDTSEEGLLVLPYGVVRTHGEPLMVVIHSHY